MSLSIEEFDDRLKELLSNARRVKINHHFVIRPLYPYISKRAKRRKRHIIHKWSTVTLEEII
jgi:hypothetical protein